MASQYIIMQFRRDTAANWTSVNPILADGEPGLDKTNKAFKIGDGTTHWNDLEFANVKDAPLSIAWSGDNKSAPSRDALYDYLTVEHNNTGTHKVVCSFSAYKSATAENVTGDGTAYAVVFDTEVFDVGSAYNNGTGTFTAPQAGKYQLCAQVFLSGLAGGEAVQVDIVTSNRTYRAGAVVAAGSFSLPLSVIADMDAADTASVTVTVSGGTKVVDVAVSGTVMMTYFSGILLK
jgi:hypothetical protein